MQEQNKEWVKCPICQKPFMKHVCGTESVFEIKCGRCKSIIRIFSAGKTACINEMTGTVSAKNSEGYSDYTAFYALTGKSGA
jgi:phage FluMu protein Com